MPQGGARNRTRVPDPGSIKSAKLGRKFRPLPVDGYDGDAPGWPLPGGSDRELELWEWAWRQPQAAAWADESWRWDAVALWVRYRVRMEQDEASAALANVVIRYADQIGFTPAGLRENGWVVGDAVEPDEGDGPRVSSSGASARERLRVV